MWRGQTLDALLCTPNTIKKWNPDALAFADEKAEQLFKKLINYSYERLLVELETLNLSAGEWRALYAIAKLIYKANFKSPILITRPVNFYRAYGLIKKPRSDGKFYFSRSDIKEAKVSLKNLSKKEFLIIYRAYEKSKGINIAFLRHTKIIFEFWESVNVIPKTYLTNLPKEICNINPKGLWILCLNQDLVKDPGYNYKTQDIASFIENVKPYLGPKGRITSQLIRFYTFLCKQRNNAVNINDRINFARDFLHFGDNTCKKNRKHIESKIVNYYKIFQSAKFLLSVSLEVQTNKGKKDILLLNPEHFHSLRKIKKNK